MPRPDIPYDGTADVCMVVEGTYPYVRGGVSAWVHNLIRALPEKSFRLLFIGATPETTYEPRYELPENVVGLHHLYAQDLREEKRTTEASGSRKEVKEAWELMKRFHDGLSKGGDTGLFGEVNRVAGDPDTRSLSVQEMFGSRRSWDLILDLYRENANDSSFVDYFWTFRFTHLPLFQLMQAELPKARVYHTVTTGFAGFLAAVAKMRLGVPMILTEHGVYTRERSIEIAQSTWIHTREAQDFKIRRTQGFFKEWWVATFKMMSRVCYENADRVITITGANQPYQIEDGADPDRMSIIPNGIDTERFLPAREVVHPEDGFVVSFVGRVVPIKDVKTLIRAAKIAAAEIPNLKVDIIGPTEEDEEYFAECKRLVDLLDLADRVTFTGPADVLEHYARSHAVVLTSISEGQPLVVLEAGAAGVPVVATNVGACSELLHGRTPEDRALGHSGILTAVASPQETADALVRLSGDEDLRRKMARTGVERVERFYREEDLNRTYLSLYDFLARKDAGSGAAEKETV